MDVSILCCGPDIMHWVNMAEKLRQREKRPENEDAFQTQTRKPKDIEGGDQPWCAKAWDMEFRQTEKNTLESSNPRCVCANARKFVGDQNKSIMGHKMTLNSNTRPPL